MSTPRRLRALSAAGMALLLCSGAQSVALAEPAQPSEFHLGSAVLHVSGQVRFRLENDRDFDIKGYRPGTDDRFLLSRVMIDASLRLSSRHRLFVELRDARETGSRFRDDDFAGSNPLRDPLDVRQAYYEGTNLSGSIVGVRLGRQQISYGDQRVFGPGQWGNTGRWCWDAALVSLKGSRIDADFWVGRPVRNRADVWPNRPAEQPLVAVAYARILGLPARVDAFVVGKRDDSGTVVGEREVGDLRSLSLGLQSEGSWHALDYSLTAVAQRGARAGDDIRAGGVSTMVGVRLQQPWEPRLRAYWTWGSGDRNPHDGFHGTFDGVLGGADIAFYGYLNLFFWANLKDRELQLVLHPMPALTLYMGGHSFALDSPRDAWYSTSLSPQRRDRTGAAGVALGRELDARAVARLRPDLELMVGGGVFYPGTFVRRTGPARRAVWHMLQLQWTW